MHARRLVILAKHHAVAKWETLGIPRAKSAELTANVRERHGR
jgi:hypothetical protein